MRSLTLVLLPALVLIAGCDRASTANEQADQAAPAAVAPAGDANAASPDEATAAPAAPTPTGGQVDRSHQGTAAPTAGFQMPGGGALTLGVFKGKPFLLNLWATWCGPCKIEMPSLDAIAAAGKLVVVPVSQDLDGMKAVQPFFERMKFRALKPYTDPGTQLSQALGNPSLPTTILYDAQGHEVWRVTGGMDWTTERAKALLAEGR